MCLSPILRPNTNYGKHTAIAHFSKDVENVNIYVPCGVCAECLSLKQNYLLQRCELMSLTHFIYFGTLTYRNGMMRSLTKTGNDGKDYTYYYADVDDFRLMIKRMRRYGYLPRGTKYLCVSEYGGEKHRMHFHFLLFIPKRSFLYSTEKPCQNIRSVKPFQSTKLVQFDINAYWSKYNYGSFLFKAFLREWKRNVSPSRKKPVYKDLCRYVVDAQGRSTYDFHYVEEHRYDDKVVSDVCAYVTKYVLKFDPWVQDVRHAIFNNYEYEDYKEIWNVIRPRVLLSKFFGCCDKVHEDHVRKTIDLTLNSGQTGHRFVFIDTCNGKVYPLSRYLLNKYIRLPEYMRSIQLQRFDHGQFDDDQPTHFLAYGRAWKEIEKNNRDYYKKREYQQKNINNILIGRVYSDGSVLLE